jgi:hypothetical protein
MPKIIKTKFTRPTTGPFNLKSRVCKICSEVIPVGPCEKPRCKETVRKAMEAIADGFIKDDEPEETKVPAERFVSSVVPPATALQALLVVSQHMHNTLDEVMVNKQHQIEVFEAMSDEDRFYASGILLRMNYEMNAARHREYPPTSFTFYEEDLPQMGSAPGWGDFETSKTRSIPLINYLASQGFTVYVPLRPEDRTFLHLGWDGLPQRTVGEYRSANFACYMPTGPLKPIGTVLRRPLPIEDEEEEEGLHAHARDRVFPLNGDMTMGERERRHTLTVRDHINNFDSRVLFGPQGVPGAYNHFIITYSHSGLVELLGAPGDVARFNLGVAPEVNWRHLAYFFGFSGWMLYNMPHLAEGTSYEMVFHFFTPQRR